MEKGDRYDRLRKIRDWNQTTVRSSSAVIVGCGALGNEVLKNLLLVGWGKITVIDFDVVEVSNLTRSILFRQQHVGRPKAMVMEEIAHEVNSDCSVTGVNSRVELALGAGLVRRTNLVFGCVDNVAARIAIGDLAGQADRLFIDGGLSAWEATISLYLPSLGGACYACGLTTEDLRDVNLRRSCALYDEKARASDGVATTPAVASIAAAWMVQQSLKWVHGWAGPRSITPGRQLRVDTAFGRFWDVGLPRNDECVFHPAPLAVESVPPSCKTWADVYRFVADRMRVKSPVLHLPVAILESWRCSVCGREEVVGRTHPADSAVNCGACGAAAILVLKNQVLGREEWLCRTPLETGVPAWMWFSAMFGDKLTQFELPNSDPRFEMLG